MKPRKRDFDWSLAGESRKNFKAQDFYFKYALKNSASTTISLVDSGDTDWYFAQGDEINKENLKRGNEYDLKL